MPIYWRYLLSNYFKVLCLCVAAFIAILLTTRLDEIAHFITLGSEGLYILLFTLYQIPYILPIALPLSCLISSMILVQRLSAAHEMTAFRSCGLSLRQILSPVLIAAALLSAVNFYIVSEIATHSHLQGGILKSRLRALNPLLILHNKHVVRMKGLYFDIMGPSQMGESASNAVLAMPNRTQSRMNVMFAKEIHVDTEMFQGKGVTLLSSIGDGSPEGTESLFVENMAETTASLEDFSHFFQKKVWTINPDHLRLSLLRARIQSERDSLSKAATPEEKKAVHKIINRSYSEILRRISVCLGVFSLTLLGAACGLKINRRKSNRGFFIVAGLVTFFLIAFFAAKAVDDHLWASSALYLLPHAIIICIAIFLIRRISKGKEA